MRIPFPAFLTALLLAATASACTEPGSRADPQLAGDTLRVPAPTGVKDTDRANVQAIFDSVSGGQTVLFDTGTYVLGEGVYLRVPDVTVVGHPEGTVLRGCEPEAFDVDESAITSVVFGCTGFFVQAERQTIRNLTFEYAWHGIVVGPYPSTIEEAMTTQGIVDPYPAGGQRIEGNTFRATPNGIRALGVGDDVSVVRDNDFIDAFHAIGIYGPPLQFLDNRVVVEQPGRVPTSGHPGSAILISSGYTDCSGHVVAGNTVEGYPGAIYVMATLGEVCRDVEIRDNTIRVAQVPLPRGWVIPRTDTDSTLVGIPITLAVDDRAPPGAPQDLADGLVEGVVVEGNRLMGAHGIGIRVGASRSRIADNVITDIRRRDPFPGINWAPAYATWDSGNGSGIWVAPGGVENRITGNVFERIEGVAVTLEGDGNLVELIAPADSVLDLGLENRVVRAARDP